MLPAQRTNESKTVTNVVMQWTKGGSTTTTSYGTFAQVNVQPGMLAFGIAKWNTARTFRNWIAFKEVKEIGKGDDQEEVKKVEASKKDEGAASKKDEGAVEEESSPSPAAKPVPTKPSPLRGAGANRMAGKEVGRAGGRAGRGARARARRRR